MRKAVFPVSIAIALVCVACNGSAKEQAAPDSGEESASETATAAPAESVKPSFDCAKAEGSIQEMVCADNTLASLDNELTRLYALAEKDPNAGAARIAELKAMQRGWIKGRDDCWKADDKRDCVMSEYAMRIMDLRQGYKNARSEDGKGVSVGPKALACEGVNYGIGITFINVEPAIATMAWKDRHATVSLVPGGSGAKYEGKDFEGPYTLWTKGDEAKLTMPGGAEMTCKIEEIG